MRSRLIDVAAIYRNMLDLNLLQDPANGIEYLKKTLRPYFVKGSANVFLYRRAFTTVVEETRNLFNSFPNLKRY